jgi:multidrug efflux system membrane fusion protein
MKRLLLAVVGFAVLGAGAFVYRYASPPTAAAAPTQSAAPSSRPLPVVTAPVRQKPVPIDLSTIGTVQPLAAVALKSRIDNQVDAVHFTEGQEVREGDLLFTLDRRVPETLVRQAEANLARDQAQLGKSRADMARYAALIQKDAVARQQYDAAVAAVTVLEATVRADNAALDAARLNLGYTEIRAPLDGRTGEVTAKPGSVVKNNEAPALVTVTQMRPIAVRFSLSERELPAVRRALAAGTVRVTARAPGDTAMPAEGSLSFIDSAVDSTTGTIAMKASFGNADGALWSGAFVQVVVTLGVEVAAVVVPAEAVQTGQNGTYVFAVTADQTVEARPVAVARWAGAEAVIGSGLSPDETVVTQGQLRLTPGAKVTERKPGA